MMNIFSTLHVYAGKWSVKSTRSFTSDEISVVKSAVCVESKYGNSVQFNMVSGGMTFIPAAIDAPFGIGEVLDVKELKLLTLEKEGETDIIRVTK